MTRQRRHQQKRRAAGKCAREGCKEQSGSKYLCPFHAAEHAKRMRERRAPKSELAVAA